MSKYVKVNAVWSVPIDGSIKDFPVEKFLETYRFAKWYLNVNDKNNNFFIELIKAVDLSLLSLKLSPNKKLTLTSEIVFREFCQTPMKTINENIDELQIVRNTYYRHVKNGIDIVNELIQDYINNLN